MAAFISYQPSDNFTTVKYTGDGTSPRSITTGFQSDLLWTKNTTSNPNLVWNSVTGSGADTELNPDSSVAMGAKDANLYGYLSAFASTTYAVTTGATNDNYVNDAAYDNAISYYSCYLASIAQNGMGIEQIRIGDIFVQYVDEEPYQKYLELANEAIIAKQALSIKTSTYNASPSLGDVDWKKNIDGSSSTLNVRQKPRGM